MSTRTTIKTECPSCGGTGLYRGMAEPEGVAVVCLTCNGSGCKELTYTPFTARKRRGDVREVKRSKGEFIFACGPRGDAISYQDFMNGKMP